MAVKVHSWASGQRATRWPQLDILWWYVTSSKPFIFLFFVLCSLDTYYIFLPHLYIVSSKPSWAPLPGSDKKYFFSYPHEMNSTPDYDLIFLTCNSIIQEPRSCLLIPSVQPLVHVLDLSLADPNSWENRVMTAPSVLPTSFIFWLKKVWCLTCIPSRHETVEILNG